MAFRLVVLDARERFQQASAFTFIGSPNPASNILSPKKMPNEGFPEVSFVDDIAYVMHSKCPAALVGSLQHVASCLHDAAASRGLTVNYGSGKAEAMVRLAGPGSAAMKKKVWHALGGKLPVVVESGTQSLQLVHSYKHLRTFMQDHGVINKDCGYRVGQARKAFGQLRRPFYGKRNVQDSTKVRVFQQLVMSRHLYNVHTWSWINTHDESKWKDGIRDAVGCLARNCIRPIPAFHFSTEELCALVGLHSPTDSLYAGCLRYLKRAVRTAPALLWSLVHDTISDNSWMSSVKRSLEWMCTHYPYKL